MANSYTKAAFHLLVSAEEAAMLRLAERAVDILDTNGADEDLALGYDSLGTAFRALFPPKGASMFESFLELFDDWSFPYLDCRVDLDEPDANGKVMAFFHGDQFGVEPVAKLIRIACPSVLPCGFAWSSDCDRLQAGEFGGGAVVITADGIDWHSTTGILNHALSRAEDPGEGHDGYVLAVRSPEDDIAYWNNTDGLGALSSATVFRGDEVAGVNPLPFEDAAWLALPAPRHG